MKEFNFKITKNINVYHLSGGISSTYSPTRWANIELDINRKVGKGILRENQKPSPYKVDEALTVVLYELPKYKAYCKFLEILLEEMNTTILSNVEDNGESALTYKLRMVNIKNSIWNK